MRNTRERCDGGLVFCCFVLINVVQCAPLGQLLFVYECEPFRDDTVSDLNTQSVPRSKHTASRLYKPVS
jgi:hypothetical protein